MSIALPEMTPEVFLRQLPKVQDFSTDSDECPVCLEQYRRTRVTATGIIDRVLAMVVHRAREPEPEPIGTEDAVRLPCQHIFGSECIKRWISPAEGDQNTCPYCVQQLFIPLRYPVSSHPLWDPLIALLGTYGYTLTPRGGWHWDQSQGATMIRSEDILIASALAANNPETVQSLFFPAEDGMAVVQTIAAARLTVDLREAVLYLQLQSRGIDLPEIGDLYSNYPFIKLGEHQEDAIFDEFERRKFFEQEVTEFNGDDSSNFPRRAIWESLRKWGLIPEFDWYDEDEGCYWLFPFEESM